MYTIMSRARSVWDLSWPAVHDELSSDSWGSICIRLAMHAQIEGRVKSLFSTMKKVLRLGEAAKGGRARDDVFDILGLRIILDMQPSHPAAHAPHDAAEVQIFAFVWFPLAHKAANINASDPEAAGQSFNSQGDSLQQKAGLSTLPRGPRLQHLVPA